MLKKITGVLAVFVVLFSVFVSANDNFLIYGKDNAEIGKVLVMTENELDTYCQQNKITYFAINNDNTKQIKRTEFVDEFSQKAVDLSVLTDAEILKLSSDISGFSEVEGEVVNYANLKFLKLRLETKDSGGDYILTEYITVKEAKKVILTFYTANGNDEGYIDQVFKEQFKSKTDYKPFLMVGIIIFVFIGLIAAAFIIKDLRQKD